VIHKERIIMAQSTFSLRTRLLIAGFATTLVVGASLFMLSVSSSDARTLPPVLHGMGAP
jgi:hypothetical protein